MGRLLREAIRRPAGVGQAIPSRTAMRDPDRSGLPKLLNVVEAKLLK